MKLIVQIGFLTDEVRHHLDAAVGVLVERETGFQLILLVAEGRSHFHKVRHTVVDHVAEILFTERLLADAPCREIVPVDFGFVNLPVSLRLCLFRLGSLIDSLGGCLFVQVEVPVQRSVPERECRRALLPQLRQAYPLRRACRGSVPSG